VRYSASRRYSVTLQSWCMPEGGGCAGGDCGGEDEAAEIEIEKSTNGVDADQPFSGPLLDAEATVTWEYVVTNTGPVALTDVQVTDDQEGAIACPKDALEPGESMTCTLTGQAPPEADVPAEGFFYANVATVVGTPPTGPDVTDEDPSNYRVVPDDIQTEPEILIEKSTNGLDADQPPGVMMNEGDAVTWSYVVTNVGPEAIEGISAADDLEGAVTCPKSSLAVDESMTCTPKLGVARSGQYVNIATVTGIGVESGLPAQDDDPSHYMGLHVDPPPADVELEKATNGHDADAAPGPELAEGDAVTWTYIVINTGGVDLTGVSVSDDREGVASCPKSSLAVGESMTCTLHGTAVVGQYANLATVTGTGSQGQQVQDSDPSHYHVPEPECGECEGKITRMELLYTGATCATIEAHATPEQRFGDPTVFGPSVVCPGETFEVFGKPSSSPGFNGTLGTNLELYINGGAQPSASIHTSCSQEVGPGFVAGSFTVVEAESQYGGLLCPLT
jgi:hypothetical protein